jgi:hypothetical protein
MFNHHYEMIMTQKQNEVEQYAKEAWKFAGLKEYGTIPKVMKLFKVTPKQVKSNSSFDTCVSC